jgi:hypothetical protein
MFTYLKNFLFPQQIVVTPVKIGDNVNSLSSPYNKIDLDYKNEKKFNSSFKNPDSVFKKKTDFKKLTIDIDTILSENIKEIKGFSDNSENDSKKIDSNESLENSTEITTSNNSLQNSTIIPNETVIKESIIVETVNDPIIKVTDEPIIEPVVEANIQLTDAPNIEVTEAPNIEVTEAPNIEVTDEPIIEVTDEPIIETVADAPNIEVSDPPNIEVTDEPIIETVADEPIIQAPLEQIVIAQQMDIEYLDSDIDKEHKNELMYEKLYESFYMNLNDKSFEDLNNERMNQSINLEKSINNLYQNKDLFNNIQIAANDDNAYSLLINNNQPTNRDIYENVNTDLYKNLKENLTKNNTINELDLPEIKGKKRKIVKSYQRRHK